MGLYLGKQRIIAINEKVATKQWITDQGYLTNTDLSDYITNEQLQPVSDKIDDVSAKVEDISTKIIKKGTLGTINGKSIEDGNNITIDLSLDDYYTKEQTDEKFLTKAEASNLADYVKNSELDTKVSEAGYVKTEALTTTLTTYAKKTDIPTVPTKLSELTNDSGYITTYTETDPVWNSEKSNYYTKTEINEKNYLTEHQSLAEYAKKSDIPTDYVRNTELADYATKTYVTEQIGSINSILENI